MLCAIMSCSKNDDFRSNVKKSFCSTNSNKDISDSIGYWHNVAICEIFLDQSNGKLGKIPGYTYYEEQIKQSLHNQDSVIFNFDLMSSKYYIADSLLDYLNVAHDDTITLDSNTFVVVFNYLKSQGEISEKLRQRLEEINQIAHQPNTNLGEFMAQVADLDRYYDQIGDQEYIDALQATALSSYEIWSENGTNPSEHPIITIWSDAAGACYGLLLGPIGSIIEGALFSSLAEIN